MKKVIFLVLALTLVLITPKSFAGPTDKDAQADFNQGMSDADINKFTEAADAFTRAIAINPEYAEAYNNRGTVYAKQGYYSKGIVDYTKAIAINPKFSEAYYQRGFIYYVQGNVTKALSDFNKAIEINPKYAEAYNDLGVTYGNQAKFTQAIANFDKAIEINPKSEFYVSRAFVYYKTKEYDKSWSDLHNAEKLGGIIDPKFIDALKKDSGRDH